MANTNERQINKNKKILNNIKMITVNVNSIIKNQKRASLMNKQTKTRHNIAKWNETKQKPRIAI